MELFSILFTALDTTTKTSVKLRALSDYFAAATEPDALWALWLLSGNTVRRAITSTQLKDWAAVEAGLPRWLFDESYIRVGDLAETVSLLLNQVDHKQDDVSLANWMRDISQLREHNENERKAYIIAAWRRLDQAERLIFTKLITGAFRVGVSRALTVRALAGHIGADAPGLLHALTGNWQPQTSTLHDLQNQQGSDVHPYPFFLASPVGDVTQLGNVGEWQFEWKWDGIRGQMVRRGGQAALWSRGEELVSQQFPELIEAMQSLPDGTVLDGEISTLR